MHPRDRKRLINNNLLLLTWLIPGLFWYFALNMTLYRAEAREQAEKISGQVIDQQEIRYTCKDSDGRTSTCTHWTYQVTFDLDGEAMTRTLLDARFDPQYFHHTDGIDHDEHPVGATMPLLLRRDLNFAVAPAFFWSAYLMPTVLAGFGVFVSFFVVISNILFWDRTPRMGD